MVPVLPAGGSSTAKFPVIPGEFPLPGRGPGEVSVEIILLAEQGAGGSVGRAGVVFPGVVFPGVILSRIILSRIILPRVVFPRIILPGILAPVLMLAVGVREAPVVVEALVVAGPGQRPGVSWAKKF